MITPPTSAPQNQVCDMLHELGIAIHRYGYQQLRIGIPQFARDTSQSLDKELYPYISDYLGCSSSSAVERTIRSVIYDAWKHQDPEVWHKYFPDAQKQPSNKEFIATLADRLR